MFTFVLVTVVITGAALLLPVFVLVFWVVMTLLRFLWMTGCEVARGNRHWLSRSPSHGPLLERRRSRRATLSISSFSRFRPAGWSKAPRAVGPCGAGRPNEALDGRGCASARRKTACFDRRKTPSDARESLRELADAHGDARCAHFVHGQAPRERRKACFDDREACCDDREAHCNDREACCDRREACCVHREACCDDREARYDDREACCVDCEACCVEGGACCGVRAGCCVCREACCVDREACCVDREACCVDREARCDGREACCDGCLRGGEVFRDFLL